MHKRKIKKKQKKGKTELAQSEIHARPRWCIEASVSLYTPVAPSKNATRAVVA
jgi:hypothetical protein